MDAQPNTIPTRTPIQMMHVTDMIRLQDTKSGYDEIP